MVLVSVIRYSYISEAIPKPTLFGDFMCVWPRVAMGYGGFVTCCDRGAFCPKVLNFPACVSPREECYAFLGGGAGLASVNFPDLEGVSWFSSFSCFFFLL